MTIHCFIHVPFEGLGNIEPWLEKQGYGIATTRLYDCQKLPEQADVDMLIVMGGPMSVNDNHEYPWLVAEKAFIYEVIAAGKPVLGICLGAQLIASALGSKVYRSEHKEIGWFPIRGVDTQGESNFQFPQTEVVFHWHGETFDLPTGAVCLAQSAGCRYQAFQVGSSVVGLQFHLETTLATAKSLVENCRDELVEGKYIQSEEQILSASIGMYDSIQTQMGAILTYLLDG